MRSSQTRQVRFTSSVYATYVLQSLFRLLERVPLIPTEVFARIPHREPKAQSVLAHQIPNSVVSQQP